MKNKVTILSLLQENGEFTNRQEVGFYLMDAGEIFISCVHPKYDDSNECISLELSGRYKSLSLFASIFSINVSQDLHLISPKTLLEQFENDSGIIDVFCEIDDINYGGALLFRKNQKGLFAKDEATEKFHQISTSLIEPEDFIRYTCHYFLLFSNSTTLKAGIRKN